MCFIAKDSFRFTHCLLVLCSFSFLNSGTAPQPLLVFCDLDTSEDRDITKVRLCFSLNFTRWHLIPFVLFTDDIHVEHSGELTSGSKLLHCEVTLSLSVCICTHTHLHLY